MIKSCGLGDDQIDRMAMGIQGWHPQTEWFFPGFLRGGNRGPWSRGSRF